MQHQPTMLADLQEIVSDTQGFIILRIFNIACAIIAQKKNYFRSFLANIADTPSTQNVLTLKNLRFLPCSFSYSKHLAF